ncbi:MAG TPA: hypothetical protein VMX38_00760 [Verrucomicrobiae bacterium]|nr:hypothetical protein [Verrucomicrobiae bacterium]
MECRLQALRGSISNLEVIAHGGKVGGNLEGWVRPVQSLPPR